MKISSGCAEPSRTRGPPRFRPLEQPDHPASRTHPRHSTRHSGSSANGAARSARRRDSESRSLTRAAAVASSRLNRETSRPLGARYSDGQLQRASAECPVKRLSLTGTAADGFDRRGPGLLSRAAGLFVAARAPEERPATDRADRGRSCTRVVGRHRDAADMPLGPSRMTRFPVGLSVRSLRIREPSGDGTCACNP